MELLLLDQEEIRALLDPDELLAALADGFIALSEGAVQAPPRSALGTDTGHLLVKPAWIPGHPMAVKLVSTFPDNRERAMPTIQAVIALVDATNGAPLAIMDGSHITAMRTAGGAALSARCLAREDARVLAIVGAGVQGNAHLQLMQRVRAFREVRIASLLVEEAQALGATEPRARVVESVRDAVHGADVVCLCTTSGTPVIESAWLSPGAHVTSVGYAPPGSELPPDVVQRARLAVESRLAFEPAPSGCAELAGLDPAMGTELGALLSGRAPGRASETEWTVYKSMGHAMEDLMTAELVYRKARERGLGKVVRL
ncbi:MAG: ornithine cyclodeaminase family protein [Gemmatimonadetes bacterium]|nr:ornithine cyclodeaminase family protein [Gemmatimonadota bacterium]